MKNLNITMTVSANSQAAAESIASRELMDMAKTIAMNKGAAMGSGSGVASLVSDKLYQIDATVQIECEGDINDITKEIQSSWVNKPGIVNSMIFVSTNEETEKETDNKLPVCDICGQVMTCACNKVQASDGVWDICDECVEDLLYVGDIVVCESCDKSFFHDTQHINPVTGEANICPICGHTN